MATSSPRFRCFKVSLPRSLRPRSLHEDPPYRVVIALRAWSNRPDSSERRLGRIRIYLSQGIGLCTGYAKRNEHMRCYAERLVLMLTTLTGLFLVVMPVSAADREIDRLLRSPITKDWLTNGGNLNNQRYSTLKQIDPSNVKQLKGAWMTRLKGSGFNTKSSFEASPLVKDGIMYIITGNDDVFALNA